MDAQLAAEDSFLGAIEDVLQSSSPPTTRTTAKRNLIDDHEKHVNNDSNNVNGRDLLLQNEDDSASQSGSARHSSGPDDEAVFDALPTTHHSSPRTSHYSSSSDAEENLILDSPSQTRPALQHVRSGSDRPSGRFTPLKSQRSPFQNPSTVRAMQLDITPPHLTTASPSSKRNGPNRMSMSMHSTRQTSTPRSDARSRRGTPSKVMNRSPTKSIKKEHPLVLLHVTLLPVPHEYPVQVLESVLPPSILANWQLLLEKTTPTVLHRGVLIPHPREDYDLLEERLLESLELKQPRILKCGHFYLSPEEEADVAALDVDEDEEDEENSELTDADLCPDCGRRIRNGQFGDTGSGSKRWDVKVFAANGLMRAGAWQAAWREMERVDVEILPWMEDSMRRELEIRNEEEERLRREEELEREEAGVGGLDDERLKEIYGQEGFSFVDGGPREELQGTYSKSRSSKSFPAEETSAQRRGSDFRRCYEKSEVPIGDLLRNYVYLMAQDRRNLVIFLLGVFVLFLAIRTSPSSQALSTTTTPGVSSAVESFTATPSVFTESESLVASTLPLSASTTDTTIPSPSLPAEKDSDPQPVTQGKHQEEEQQKPNSEEEKEASSEEEQGSSWTEAAGEFIEELMEEL